MAQRKKTAKLCSAKQSFTASQQNSTTLAAREEELRNRHIKIAVGLSQHTRHLTPLVIGDHVRIQNQTGPHPTKWDQTGIVIEVHQFDQYVVCVDGSGLVTLRNKKFLRRYTPAVSCQPHHFICPPTPAVEPHRPSINGSQLAKMKKSIPYMSLP